MSVGHHRLVLPDGSGILHIITDAWSGGDRHTLQYFGRDQYPAGMADLPDRLLGIIEILHQLQYCAVAADFVGSPASGYQDAVIIGCVKFIP